MKTTVVLIDGLSHRISNQPAAPVSFIRSVSWELFLQNIKNFWPKMQLLVMVLIGGVTGAYLGIGSSDKVYKDPKLTYFAHNQKHTWLCHANPNEWSNVFGTTCSKTNVSQFHQMTTWHQKKAQTCRRWAWDDRKFPWAQSKQFQWESIAFEC